MRLLITAGPTREFLDSVRFISNPSTGKMGYAIARAAVRRGHEVTLISGPAALREPVGVRIIHVTTAEEMLRASVGAFRRSDAAVMTAAVCDYRPVHRALRKEKKQASRFSLPLELTTDICACLGHSKRRRIVVGFAMEDHDHRAHAQAKLRAKNCDAIVLNGPDNVGADRAEIEILTADGEWRGPFRGTKRQAASRIVSLIERLAKR